jgi:DNA polymerase III alpha subunit
VAKCVENGYTACGIADRESITGAVEFFQKCKAAKIKPIIGCSFNGFTLFVKNKAGWSNLINIISTNSFTELNCKKENLICLADQQSLIHPSIIEHFGDDILVNDGSIKEYFYTTKLDVDVHRISLASGAKLSLHDANYDAETARFFKSKDFEVPDKDKAVGSDLIKFIVDSCEEYNILSNPVLPKFPTPNGETEEEYLRYLCNQGWENKLEKKGKLTKVEKRKQYKDQYETEFAVFKKAKLFGYFLIVADILDFLKKNDWLAGPGRGCFLPDTRVRMPDEQFKPISLVNIGDLVVDAYGKTQRVYDTLEYEIEEEILEIEMQNGKIIRCTKDHKFLTNNRGWVEAKDLTEEDDIKEV